jgi:uncharacterized membrane protein YfcA
MIDSLSFYLLAVPVVLLVGISKGGFGGGLGTMAVPLLALMIDPRLAAAILLPILCVMDLFSVWSFRGTWDKSNLKTLLPGALLGTLAGALTFSITNADMIRILVGVLALYFVAHYLWGLRMLQHARRTEAGMVRGTFWGTIAGYTSYIAHAGGPPVSIYLLPQQLPKISLVGTTVLFFTIINYIKLIPYAWLGQLNTDTLLTSLMLMPLAPIGVKLGVYLLHKVSEKWFYWTCYGFLFVAGLKLVHEGITNLLP